MKLPNGKQVEGNELQMDILKEVIPGGLTLQEIATKFKGKTTLSTIHKTLDMFEDAGIVEDIWAIKNHRWVRIFKLVK